MQVRSLIILVFCQLISATGSIVFITLGGIIGATLTNNKAWVTLPLSMVVVVTAATTIPATALMRRVGRGRGFALASVSAILAVMVAFAALINESFRLFVCAAMLFGINMAFTQQYRYAAAESVETQFVPRAISLVLLGSIGGALLGPEIAARGQHWIGGAAYAGPLLVLAGLYALQGVLFLFLPRMAVDAKQTIDATARPLSSIVGQPVFIVAVLAGTAGYGIMTLLMTATPLSMHVNDGHSVAQTANVIRAHVLGMYLPSLVSGILIQKLGVVRMMLAGAIALLAATVVGLQGQAVAHYWWALVLLGVGWNFLYVGATTMLTYTYSFAERFRAQGVNEFLVFGTAAMSSLLAGTMMYYFGWQRLILIPLPLLVAVCIALVLVRNDKLLFRAKGGAGQAG